MDIKTLKAALKKSDFLASHIIICGVGSGDKEDSDKEEQ